MRLDVWNAPRIRSALFWFLRLSASTDTALKTNRYKNINSLQRDTVNCRCQVRTHKSHTCCLSRYMFIPGAKLSKSREQYRSVYHCINTIVSLWPLQMPFFSRQFHFNIRLLSCATLWWPCCLYPASPVWMTADKSPVLLLTSLALCNSTAGECAFSYDAHCHKSTKNTGTNHR